MERCTPHVVRLEDLSPDGWDDPVKGRIGWRTLFSADATPTAALTAGVAKLQPGGWLGLHRHEPAEIYYVLEGRGVVTLDGAEIEVGAGSAVFIPGDTEQHPQFRRCATTVALCVPRRFLRGCRIPVLMRTGESVNSAGGLNQTSGAHA